MKKILIAVLCAALMLCAAAYFRRDEYSRTEYMFDTMLTITANDKTAVDESFAELRRIENLLSTHLPDSEISTINAAPAGTAVPVSAETFALLKRAEEYKALTGGAFDVTIKPLADLWNVSGGGNLPTDAEISAALELVGDVILNEETLTVTLPADGMAIDLGGIAKGYAGERVREILLSHGITSAIADLGGNIVALGDNDGKPWRIGLQKPYADRGTTFTHVDVTDKHVVTSGGYERYFEKDGQAFHHIFDPATGRNPENDILSVTVVSDNGAMADALSTACCVMGTEKALTLAAETGTEIVICTPTATYSSP